MTYKVNRIESQGMSYYFLDLKGTDTFRYEVIQNKGSNLEKAVHAMPRPTSNSLFGISHLIEHMSFKNTLNYGTKELSEKLKNTGYHNAATSQEYVLYYLKSISEYTDEAIKMVNNIAFNDLTRVTDLEFTTEKDIVISEANLVYENPQDIFYHNSTSRAYGLDKFDNVIGNPDTIKDLVIEDLVDTKKYFMRKDNLAFKIIYDSDNISPQQIIDKIERSLSSYWSNINRDADDSVFNDTFLKLTPKMTFGKTHTITEQSEYPKLIINQYFDVPRHHKLIYGDWTADYLNYYSKTGLFETIREKEGLCYSINIYTSQEFNSESYHIITEVPKDKYEVYTNTLLKSISDTLDGFDQESFKSYYDTHKRNEKINLLNLNSLSGTLDNLIDNPDIFNQYENLLATKGIVAYIDQVQKDYMTYDNMKSVLSDIKTSFDTNKVTTITN